MTVQFDIDAAEAAPPRDAATVLPVRAGANGRPEIFFVKRNATARFMAGAYVFPGGRVDPGDNDPSVPGDLDPAQCSALLGEGGNPGARGLLVAALRECLEESGLLLSVAPTEDSVRASLRAGLEQRPPAPFAALLRDAGVSLRLSALRPLTRWVTPKAESKRFDARFFLAEATPSDGLDPRHDGRETVDSAWITADEAIARAEQGTIILAPPTWRVLAELRDADTLEALLACASHGPQGGTGPFEPAVVMEEDQLCVLLPDDPHFPAGRAEGGQTMDSGHSRLPTAFGYHDGIWQRRR